jgi:drug/metabolite transporter (DMT)-like permease
MVTPQKNNLAGILFMLGNSLAVTILYAISKHLTATISSHQVVFLYKAVVLVALIPWLVYVGLDCVKTKRLKLHLLRGFVSTAGALCFFYGLSKVDIASATALNKTEPIILMLVAALYFKEKLTSLKITAALFSFIGMLFVVYPVITLTEAGLTLPWLSNTHHWPEFNYNYLIIMIAVLLWTLNTSVVKELGRTESNRTQLFYVSVISVLVAAPTALFHWEVIAVGGLHLPWIQDVVSFAQFTPYVMAFIAVMGLMHFTHVSCYFMSFKLGEMSVVVPFDYSRLVFGGMVSYLIFKTMPQLSQLIGYALILISGVYLLYAQARAKRKG